ncbi:epimerase, partial [Mycobacterium avium subsp. paratuberculosis 10-4404]
VDAVVAQADVVIHLAFIIMGSRDESARVNLQGTRNVFEATVAAGRPRRLVYTSSVAAYGYHSDNPVPLTEDVPARGSAEHYYSAQKAASEAMLAEITKDSPLEVFVLRPCIVAGPGATALADAMPWNQLPGPLRAIVKAVQAIPVLKPVVPDPGYPLQLVHHDDVASAIALAATAPAPPGAYNIAGDGVVTVADVAKALGGRPVRVPAVAATAASAAISKAPLVPSMLEWLHTARTSMVMDTTKAKTQLGWRPVHTSAQALAALASAV